MSASRAIDIDRIESGAREVLEDEVAVEEPLEIQLCSASRAGAAAQSLSITMRTPGDDFDLARGFLLSESIIVGSKDIRDVSHVGAPDDETGLRNVVRVELAPEVALDTQRLQRHFYTTSSCGVCGKASLDAIRAVGIEPPGHSFALPRAALITLPDKLRRQQRLFATTGGLHAAAAFDTAGNLVVIREDVGRHNAVDKVVGALLAQGRIPATDLGLLVSGRASFELAQKALVAGMPMLAAVSAPSSLAVRLAREFGLTLIGFLRGSTFNIYAGGERLEL